MAILVWPRSGSADSHKVPIRILSGFPVVGVSMQVHDRHDHDLVGQFLEKDAKRECLCEATPDIEFYDGVEVRIEANTIDGVLHRREKTPTEVWLLRLVVCRRTNHLGLGVWMELDDLHASDA